MLDGTGKSSPNLTYTCVVGTAPRLEYITWRDVLKKGTLVQLDCSTKPYDTYYLDHSEDRFSNLNCVLQSETIKSNRFSYGIDLVLPSTLYKFIVWAVWVWAQSCFGINPISVPTVTFLIKIRWSYNLVYHCNKCSMIFVKKTLLENLKIFPLED